MEEQTLTMPQELIGTVAADDVMRYDRVEPDAHFTLPARPTVRQQLEYYSRYNDTRSDPMYLRLWYSAQVLIKDWQSEVLPMSADLIGYIGGRGDDYHVGGRQ
jgi:hypothetical protein